MKKMAIAVMFCLVFLPAMSSVAVAAEPLQEQYLVDQAQITLDQFQASPEMQFFRDALRSAKGVLIIPSLYRAGLVFGGSGGKGVYLAKDPATGEWRGPSFYNLGSFTVGIQAGGEVAQVILLAMTDEAVNKMLSPQFKLGSIASAAAGPTGLGISGNSAVPPTAFMSFARTKGLYGGLNLEGAVINPDVESNAIYYGRYVTPEDIFVKKDVSAPMAAGLRNEMARVESAVKTTAD